MVKSVSLSQDKKCVDDRQKSLLSLSGFLPIFNSFFISSFRCCFICSRWRHRTKTNCFSEDTKHWTALDIFLGQTGGAFTCTTVCLPRSIKQIIHYFKVYKLTAWKNKGITGSSKRCEKEKGKIKCRHLSIIDCWRLLLQCLTPTDIGVRHRQWPDKAAMSVIDGARVEVSQADTFTNHHRQIGRRSREKSADKAPGRLRH